MTNTAPSMEQSISFLDQLANSRAGVGERYSHPDMVTFNKNALTEPMRILIEGLELMMKKSGDYQAKESTVRQADYYPNGIITLHDIIHAKKLRFQSVMEKAQAGKEANFESIEDSLKDLMNYCAIAAAWCRGKIDGQDPGKDIFNR